MAAYNLASPSPGMSQYTRYTNTPTQGASARDTMPRMSGPGQANGDMQNGGKPDASMNRARETKMGSLAADLDLQSTLYELWQFIPKTNKDGGKAWSSPKRKLIPSDQGTLEDLVKTTEKEGPVHEQYLYLSKKRRDLIDDLIEEHNQRDPRFEWTCVCIKTERRAIKTPLFGFQEIHVKMDVVILRKLRLRAIPATMAFKNNAVAHVSPQNVGNIIGFGGNQAFEGTGRNTATPQLTGNLLGPSKAPGNGNSPANAGMPPSQSQMYLEGQPPAHPHGHPPVHSQGHPPTHPLLHAQGNQQGQLPPQFSSHQVSSQAQPSMPANSSLPISGVPGGHTVGPQGSKAGPGVDQVRQHTPHQPVMGPQMGDDFDQIPGSFAGRLINEPRPPPVPVNMGNTHGKPVQREPSTKNHATPRYTRKSTVSILPPKVIQQERQLPHGKRAAYDPDDSSSRTEDESLFGDDGYSSASSVESVGAKGSLNWQKKYLDPARRAPGYRVHDRKQGHKDRGHTIYPATTVDTFLSTSALRKRENKRVDQMAPYSRPVTVHGGNHGYQRPGPSEFDIETSFRLLKVHEGQQQILDKLNRLERQSQERDGLDHAGDELVVRGMEPDMPMLGRRAPYYPEMQPFYRPRRRVNYVPRETMPYVYEPYY